MRLRNSKLVQNLHWEWEDLNRRRKENPLSFWTGWALAVFILLVLALQIFTPWQSHRVPQASAAATSTVNPGVELFVTDFITIDPSTCAGPKMGMSVEKKDDICTITFEGTTYDRIEGVGGWCSQLDLTTPAPEGSAIVRIKPVENTGTSDDFSFALYRGQSSTLTLFMQGVIESRNGSVPCNEHYLTKEDRN